MRTIQPGLGYTVVSNELGDSLVIDDFQVQRQQKLTPFTVTAYKQANAWKFRVVPGTVNNVVPYINEVLMTNPTVESVPLSTTATSGSIAIVLRCVAPLTVGGNFPINDPSTQIVAIPMSQVVDTDLVGHIVLAVAVLSTTAGVTNCVLYQMVSGSLWAERHKWTEPNTATYYFYRI